MICRGFDGTLRYISAAHVPFPEFDAVVAIVVEVALALLLLIGYQTRWMAQAFIVYLMVLAFAFHPYWAAPVAQMDGQKLHFYKDLAMAGGLFAIAAWGPGRWSIDGRLGKAWRHRSICLRGPYPTGHLDRYQG